MSAWRLMFLGWFLTAATTLAAPPSFDPPAVVPVVSGVAVYMPPADCVSVKYIGLDGEEEFPLELVGGSKTGFAFITRGLPAGKTYRFAAVASSATGEQVERLFAVVVPGGGNPPPVDPNPPVDPPPVPVAAYYFMIIRPDGPADAAFTKYMTLPAWDHIRAKGHTVKDFTATKAKQFGLILPNNVPFPMQATLVEGKTTSVLVRPVTTAPADPMKLLEGLK